MKGFCKDYVSLCKDSGKFYKKHWKGVIVLTAVLTGVELAYFYRESIKDKLKEKFCKGKES